MLQPTSVSRISEYGSLTSGQSKNIVGEYEKSFSRKFFLSLGRKRYGLPPFSTLLFCISENRLLKRVRLRSYLVAFLCKTYPFLITPFTNELFLLLMFVVGNNLLMSLTHEGCNGRFY